MEGVELLLRVKCLWSGCPSTCTTTGEAKVGVYGDFEVLPLSMPEGWVARSNKVFPTLITGYWCPVCVGKGKADGQARKTT